MTPQQAFDELSKQPNGPAKKFYLVKKFGPALREMGHTNLAELGCDQIAALIKENMKRFHNAR
jgi:hypothetical protein